MEDRKEISKEREIEDSLELCSDIYTYYKKDELPPSEISRVNTGTAVKEENADAMELVLGSGSKEKYNEAECFFNKDGKFNQLRLTTYCKSKDNAITRMNNLSKKYEGRYNITNSENLDDGKFVVGYNSKNRTMIMISTYKNNCDVSFSLF